MKLNDLVSEKEVTNLESRRAKTKETANFLNFLGEPEKSALLIQ